MLFRNKDYKNEKLQQADDAKVSSPAVSVF